MNDRPALWSIKFVGDWLHYLLLAMSMSIWGGKKMIKKFAFILGVWVSSLIMAAPVQAGRTAIDFGGGAGTVLSGYCDFNGADCAPRLLDYKISFDGGATFTRSISITGNGLLTFGTSVDFGASDPVGNALRDKIIAANDLFYEIGFGDPALTDYGMNLISAGQNNSLISGAFNQSGQLTISGNTIRAEWFTCKSPGVFCREDAYGLTLTATPTGFNGVFDFQGRGNSDVGYVVNGNQTPVGDCDALPECSFFLPAIISTDVTTAAPEPASWAMMLCGFGLVGGALRRRSTRSQLTLA